MAEEVDCEDHKGTMKNGTITTTTSTGTTTATATATVTATTSMKEGGAGRCVDGDLLEQFVLAWVVGLVVVLLEGL